MSDLAYDQWLDEVADLAGYSSGHAMICDTGHECWREYWDDGCSPQETWDEECSYVD